MTRVVCPVSLVGQWASEVGKMAVGLGVVQHHGTNRTTSTSTRVNIARYVSN